MVHSHNNDTRDIDVGKYLGIKEILGLEDKFRED